jgi:hypothetical protein
LASSAASSIDLHIHDAAGGTNYRQIELACTRLFWGKRREWIMTHTHESQVNRPRASWIRLAPVLASFLDDGLGFQFRKEGDWKLFQLFCLRECDTLKSASKAQLLCWAGQKGAGTERTAEFKNGPADGCAHPSASQR